MPISDMSSCTELRSHSLMWATVCQTHWTMKTHIKKKNKGTHPVWCIDLDSVTKRVVGKEDRVVFSADVHFIHSCIVQNVIKLLKNVWDEKWARQLLDLDYNLAFTQKISHNFYCFHDLIQFRFLSVVDDAATWGWEELPLFWSTRTVKWNAQLLLVEPFFFDILMWKCGHSEI